MKTFKLYTLGCKSNQYDAQVLRERFEAAGFKELSNGKPASVCVINTCTVTHKADSDSLNFIRRAKRDNPGAKIIVTGCLAEVDRERILSLKGIHLIIGNDEKSRIFPRINGITYFKNHTRAFLKIQDGCDNFCSYCKVPLVRGRSRSRLMADITAEASTLVKNGYKEIVLTGICLGAYGKDLKAKKTLVDVVEDLEKIEGLLRIRLSSIEALDISDELIKKIAASQKLCKHLHIPLQSGDGEILKKMNRKYSRMQFLRLVQKIKKAVPGISITTDVLVGFPTEKEENFRNTLDLIRKIQPLKTHIFPYSVRPGTAAAKLSALVEPLIVKERIARLKKVSGACAKKYLSRFKNKRLEVLIEGPSQEKAGYWEGYTSNYIKRFVKSKHNLKNKIISA